jgi:predicted transcriptional regulator
MRKFNRSRLLPLFHRFAEPATQLRRFYWRALTGKRMELLRYVRRHDVASIRALAKALGRDYSNVHADVQALTGAGLLDASSGGVRADYDAIETRIAI